MLLAKAVENGCSAVTLDGVRVDAQAPFAIWAGPSGIGASWNRQPSLPEIRRWLWGNREHRRLAGGLALLWLRRLDDGSWRGGIGTATHPDCFVRRPGLERIEP